MKKINILIILISSLVLILSGCYELDRFPQQQLSPKTFWKTELQAKQAVNGCYAALKNDEVYYFNKDIRDGEFKIDSEDKLCFYQDLHAKIFIGKRGKLTDWFIGSANCSQPFTILFLFNGSLWRSSNL